MFCKYLSDFYLMDHDFYSEDKSYFYLSDNLNSRLNKELLIKHYWDGSPHHL